MNYSTRNNFSLYMDWVGTKYAEVKDIEILYESVL